MNLDAGGIQTDHVYLDFDDSQLLQTQKCFFQNSLFRPAVYPDIDHVPISVFFGQAPPFAPIFHYVQRRIQYIQIADFCWFPLFRKALCDLFVLFFLQFHSLIIAYLRLCEQTLTNPAVNYSKYKMEADDLVLIALPSYGGRVPGLAAERLAKIPGNSAKCVLLCVYGNRAYEDTLVEMADVAKKAGFSVVAAISAVAEHSIMHQYASGRPNQEDERQLKSFAKVILEKFKAGTTGWSCRLQHGLLLSAEAIYS